jgi:hypothetical protein
MVSSVMYVNIIVQLVLSGSLHALWGMINSMQLIMHVALFQISLPAIVLIFIQNFISLVKFDIFDLSTLLTILYGFTPNDAVAPYNDNFNMLGYVSTNMIENLGPIFLYIELFFPIMIICILLRLVRLKW